MDKLLNCPFCGEKPTLRVDDISCKCGVKFERPLCVTGNQSFLGLPTYKEARQQMIDKWNTRALGVKEEVEE